MPLPIFSLGRFTPPILTPVGSIYVCISISICVWVCVCVSVCVLLIASNKQFEAVLTKRQRHCQTLDRTVPIPMIKVLLSFIVVVIFIVVSVSVFVAGVVCCVCLLGLCVCVCVVCSFESLRAAAC